MEAITINTKKREEDIKNEVSSCFEPRFDS
jgi:hypothetical protein